MLLTVHDVQAAMGGGGMAGAGPAGMMGGDGQVPAHLMDAMQGVDEEMLADMVGNLPADQAAELQRLVQEGSTLGHVCCLGHLLHFTPQHIC